MISVDNYLAELHHTIDSIPLETLYEVINALYQARIEGRRIFLMGNGGSAATAAHMACDLPKNTRTPHLPGFRIVDLSANISTVTAYANDEGYENIFAQQILTMADPRDIAIGISTSGNSLNILRAMEAARQIGMQTIGFTGFQGGRLGEIVDINLCVPSNSVEHIEDTHLIIEHLIVSAFRQELNFTKIEQLEYTQSE